MSFLLLPVLVVCATVPLAASASSAASDPTPLHSEVPVPSTTYSSAFQAYQSIIEPVQTPDKSWRDANETVGALKGHAGHMKMPSAAAEGSFPPATPSSHLHDHH